MTAASLLPLVAAGLTLGQAGVLVATYPALWGALRLVTGACPNRSVASPW